MQGLAMDDAAWSSAWRTRAVGDKAVLSLGLVLCALILPPWPGAVIVTLVALVTVIVVARTPWRPVLKAVAAPATFIALGAVSVAVTVSADPDWSVGVTSESGRRALEVTGHAVAGTTAMLVLAMTTPMSDVLGGLRRLRVPRACVDVADVMYRFLFVLLVSVRTIRQSQAARLGWSSPRRSLRSAGLLTAAVLVKSWDRASRLEDGLAGREFGDSPVVPPVDAKPSSPLFLASTALVLVVVTASSLVAA